jgi:hypothetical protein
MAKATADDVGTTGFEPATSCTPCKRATGLRYVPKNPIPAEGKITLKFDCAKIK